jgi:catechol 2,3-dioxygenase-like lactoylglutathione lyase family enzyme
LISNHFGAFLAGADPGSHGVSTVPDGDYGSAMPLHHVAYATKDVEATARFYEELMGFPLVHAETTAGPNGEWIRHIFFDIGPDADGHHESIAFFQVNKVGERDDYVTNVSDGVGLPVWVNHCAFRATREKQEEVRARMAANGIQPFMDQDHGWCHSLYFIDPNGIMVELCRDTPGFTPDNAEARRMLTADPLANAKNA